MGATFEKMQNSLENKITERPDPEKLVEQGILPGNKKRKVIYYIITTRKLWSG